MHTPTPLASEMETSTKTKDEMAWRGFHRVISKLDLLKWRSMAWLR